MTRALALSVMASTLLLAGHVALHNGGGLALASRAMAQTQAPAVSAATKSQNSAQPLEITAQKTLEWKRNDKLLVATGDAVATQGTSQIKAEVLSAFYREGDGQSMKIWQVTADRDVDILSGQSTASGDAAVYDLDKGLAVMTGNNLRMVSPDQTVTARERFEYWVNDGRLNAIGGARVERVNEKGEHNTLESDKISAVLKDNDRGQRVLHSLEATGNVVITTPTEIVRGTYGIYKADTNQAEITGGVTIKRGPNTLEGDRAEVDLNTNVSRIFGGKGQQVQGVFYPGSDDLPAPGQ